MFVNCIHRSYYLVLRSVSIPFRYKMHFTLNLAENRRYHTSKYHGYIMPELKYYLPSLKKLKNKRVVVSVVIIKSERVELRGYAHHQKSRIIGNRTRPVEGLVGPYTLELNFTIPTCPKGKLDVVH